MPLIVDGYNLLFAAGFIGRNLGSKALEHGRLALLRYLARYLESSDLATTTVVFDAKDAPPGRSPEFYFQGIHILFARDHDEADDLILELIRRDSAAQRLLLVTSDIRLQQAARRRRVKVIKSEDWLDLLDSRAEQQQHQPAALPPVVSPRRVGLAVDEVDDWLREFGLETEFDELLPATEPTDSSKANSTDWPVTTGAVVPSTPGALHKTRAEAGPSSARPVDRPAESATGGAPQRPADKPAVKLGTESNEAAEPRREAESGWGPFPPGYGDDLLDGVDS